VKGRNPGETMANSGGVAESRSVAAQHVLALAAVCRFFGVKSIWPGDELHYPRPQVDAAAKVLGLLPADARQELVEALSIEYLKAYGRVKEGVNLPELRELKEFVLARYRLLLEEHQEA
jgi:hypothetical protein